MAPIPYSRQSVTEEDISGVAATLRSEFLTQGPKVPELEAAFAQMHGVRHAVAVSSATAGLHIACLALGVGPGSRVWTSPNSFVASANCALYCGATVDFVDIDPATRNMSVGVLEAKLQRAKSMNELPDVVIPVDFAGLPCDLAEIYQLAEQYDFKVLEDGSHATGATYARRPVGHAYSHVTVFSFHAVKIVTTAEGGIVTTQDEELARSLRLLRSHGVTRDESEMERASEGGWYYEQVALGFNYRLTDVQASLGVSQLLRLDEMARRRNALADRYDALLLELPLILPTRLPDRCSAWHLYVVEIDESRSQAGRAEVFRAMRDRGIGVNVHYIPIHTHPYFERLGHRRGDFPASERYYGRALTLPLFPDLSEDDQAYVARSLAALV